MTFLSFLFLLFVASLAGGIGAKIAGRKDLGCLTSIVLGFVGAYIGTYIAEKLDLPLYPLLKFGPHPFPVIWAVVGAALFVALLNLFTSKK